MSAFVGLGLSGPLGPQNGPNSPNGPVGLLMSNQLLGGIWLGLSCHVHGIGRSGPRWVGLDRVGPIGWWAHTDKMFVMR